MTLFSCLFFLSVKMIEMKFFDRDEVKIWIIKNQFGRRNLIPFQRGELALVLKPLVAAKAKERMEAGINQHSSPLQKSEKGKPIHTDEEIAKHAGVSRDTIRKVGADEVRKSYQAYIEKKLGNEWEFMRDWGGKLTGAVVRIAALMHAAECLGPPTDSPISAETMASATSLGEFFSGHAEAAYQLMGANESQADAKYILKRLSAVRLNRVTRSELTRLCRGKFGKAEDMTAALNILVERRYLQEVETDVGYNNRTQIAYFINPAIAGNDGNNGNDAA